MTTDPLMTGDGVTPGAAPSGTAPGPVPPGAAPPGGAPAGHVGEEPSGPGETRSLGEIVGDIASDLSALVKQEIELAKTEAKAEATKAGKGLGFLGGAGLTGYITLLFLSLALMFLLDTWMHAALAALIVGVIWGIVAAVMAMTGRKELKSVRKLDTTQQTLKEDAAWARQLKNNG